jgi:hypothetical protein
MGISRVAMDAFSVVTCTYDLTMRVYDAESFQCLGVLDRSQSS